MGHPRYSKEEIVRRGEELYQQGIRQKVEPGNKGKTLVIDIETGEYEINEDHLAANRQARAKHPDAALYGLRIGCPPARIGGSSLGFGGKKPRISIKKER